MNHAIPLLRPFRIAMWLGAAALLALPALAMRFAPGAGVDWSGGDFLVMGAMLAAACGAIEFGLRRAPNLAYVAAVVLAVGTGFVTVWANLAVGMIGDQDNSANWLFVGVLGIAAIGAMISRFRASGLARASIAAGLAQALIGAGVALSHADRATVAALIAAFALPWWLASGLFALADTRAPDPSAGR